MRNKCLKCLGIMIAIIFILLHTGYSKSKLNKYTKFGISFYYPADLKVTEIGAPLYGEKVTKESGVLKIGNIEDIFTGRSEVYLEILWVPGPKEDTDRSLIQKIGGAYLDGRKKDHDLYPGTAFESEQNSHWLMYSRFCTVGKEGYSLNVIGSWYCDISKRVFMINTSSLWKKPVLITDGSKVQPEWPDLKKDSSAKAYENLLSTFNCHQ